MTKRKGFTLIELMIVIAIIGILAAIAIPNFRKARESAREKACYANMRVILGAVEMYNMDNTSMMSAVSVAKLVTLKYLRKAPQAPESDCVYSQTSSLDDGGVILCTGKHGTIESSGT